MDGKPAQQLLAAADEALTNGNWEQALNLYRQVLQQDPRSAHALNKIGVVMAQRGDLDGAEQHFQKALASDQKLAQAHSNLGNIYLARGEYRQALAEYDTALRLAPDSPVFLENQAAALKKLGRVTDAVATLKRAHRLDRQQARTELRANLKNRAGCLLPALLMVLALVLAIARENA